ncbi:MAG: FlgO family outer membrane protein [Xanthomarina gelatinilytica]|uniref:FlgO family outer membrane protein n=1 Tax=Xanthomarina gelatinilytica TaxID=1137281 RepID=UPI003A85EC7F
MRTRFVFAFILMTFFTINKSTAQAGDYTDYDTQMRQLALDVAKQVKVKQKLNIAVWYFKNSFRDSTALGDYMAQEFAVYFTNISDGFDVMDRDAIDQVLEEHRLNDQGFIDPKTAKELGMYIQADAVVTGTVDVANSHSLKIRIKLIDVQTGKTLAAIPRNISKDENIKYILHETGINETKNIDKKKKRLNRGERYGNPEYVDSNCERQNIGDYCFENDTDKNFKITLYMDSKTNNGYGFYRSTKKLSLVSGSSGCFTDVPVQSYKYEMKEFLSEGYLTTSGALFTGQLKVERCKSIIYNISTISPTGMNHIQTTPNNKQSKKIQVKDVLDVIEPILKKD